MIRESTDAKLQFSQTKQSAEQAKDNLNQQRRASTKAGDEAYNGSGNGNFAGDRTS
jgi:hypothetical protein